MRLSAVGLAVALILPVSAWSAEILTAEGLGPVKIGMSRAEVEKALGAKLKLQGADSPRECATADHPNGKAWMMFHEYRLVRIDIEKPGITAPEGGGVGTAETTLRKLYGKRAEFGMHPYGDEPNDHYVTVALPAKDRLLIFETRGRRVESFRIGTRDAAPLIEGCS
jgi:hypothetical protein